MAPPHWGQASGSTSKICRRSSAHRRRASQWFDDGLETPDRTTARRQGPAVARFFAMSFARITASTPSRRPTLPLE